MFKISSQTHFLIQQALREDIGKGDITTRALIPSSAIGKARIEAKEAGILCGGPIVSEVFRQMDPKLKVFQRIRDGAKVRKGQIVFLLRGRIKSILTAERVALNFLSRLSGIATLTNKFVGKMRGAKAKILDTRKTTPLWRELERYAVRCGGGQNHRFGLWDEILVKDNHWQFVKSAQKMSHALQLTKRKGIPVEIEVAGLRQLERLLNQKFVPNRILLDNFSVSDLKKAVRMTRRARPKLLLEASGGITLSNVRQIAKIGVDRISIGALTHSAPALDFSLEISHVYEE